MADQSPQLRKINYWSKFLGVEVPVFTGAERMAKELDVPVVFAKMSKIKRGRYEMKLELITEKPNSVEDFEITEKYLRLVENQIHEDPNYYFWTHNRFKHSIFIWLVKYQKNHISKQICQGLVSFVGEVVFL